MQTAKVMQLFRLFACIEDAKPWADLVDAAILGVSQELRDPADADDIRLCYYAAAAANLQYRQLMLAASASPTYAGAAVSRSRDFGECTLAERLVREYRKAVKDLLRDDAFVFAGVSAGSDS